MNGIPKIPVGIFSALTLLLLLLPSPVPAESPKNEAEASFKEGMNFNKQRRLAEAISKLTRAVELSPETHKYHQALFTTFMATRRGLQAVRYYEDLVAQHPQSPVVHYWMGRLYLAKSALADAVREFQYAADLSQNDSRPWIALGHARLRLGDDEEALQAYLRANGLAPHVASVHDGIGRIYFKRGKYAEARKEYEEALKIDPALPDAQFHLGLIYEKAGEFAEAVLQYEALLEADPNESRARERLGDIYFRSEQYELAVREYATLSQIRPNATEIILALGEAQIMLAAVLGDVNDRRRLKEMAIQSFQRTLELDPDNEQAHQYLEQLDAEPASSHDPGDHEH